MAASHSPSAGSRSGAGRPSPALAALRRKVLHDLRSCATEADIVQVLYAGLHATFGYDGVSLQVLEREGWYHTTTVDQGVLQDVRRRLLAASAVEPLYQAATTQIFEPGDILLVPSRGPGFRRRPRTVVWVPLQERGQTIGSISYQSYDKRAVSDQETALLEQIHRHLGVLVSNAFLNEITRNQAVRLTALNAIARALASTLDEQGVVTELHTTLSQLLKVDQLELVTMDQEEPGRVRVLRISSGADRVETFGAPQRSPRLREARSVLLEGSSRLRQEAVARDPHGSAVSVPVSEGGRLLGALSVYAQEPEAYEDSTVTFLEQVADEAALAIQKASSYAALEAHRRRLEVVNAVGRRLASSLDRWSIMRTLREELARHIDFDLFVLMVVKDPSSPTRLEGYLYDSGVEQPVPEVELSPRGPSREVYESRRPVLVHRSPWARSVEAGHPSPESWVLREGAAVFVTRRARPGRVATRSFVWVPVMQGERVTALLSLQSYRTGAFGSWHVHLLEDIAAHVSLALANAGHYSAAQEDRRRLEALLVLEMGVAGSADERQIAEAVFTAFTSYLVASHYVLAYLDAQGRLTGFGCESGGPMDHLEPQPVDRTHFFQRLVETGTAIVERVPEHLREPLSAQGWATADRRFPQQAIWVPIFQADRVVGALSAQRFEDEPFGTSEVQLLEGAAPIVGIALRSVRVHRSHERALARSVHIQEVAALAGHEIGGVVATVAEQARVMLDAAGVACWAFDSEGRVTAQAAAGSDLATRVLAWSGYGPGGTWTESPRELVAGSRRSVSWTLIPLWASDRLVGALGSVNPASGLEDPGTAQLEFARHAAIAIENSRLVAETRGRIHTLEAVAAFTDLDIARPEATRAEMGLLVERALAASSGALWLLDGGRLFRPGGAAPGPDLIELADPTWLARALRGDGYRRRLRDLLRELSAGLEHTLATPIRSGGRLMGMLVAQGGGSDPGEVRRQMAVLAGQAALVLARLQLVDALDRERQMMNAILRNSPVGVMLLDTGGRVVYANEEIENIYRLPPGSILGRTEAEVLGAAGATPGPDDDRSSGSPVELNLSEPERVVQVRRVSIPDSAGQAAGELTLHEDVTEERQLMEAKDLMLRAIGHEVLSPAAAMRTTLAGLLQWDPGIEPPDRQRLVEEAYEMSERLLNLVESQLVISKLETRRFDPNPSTVVLSAALAEVLAVLHHRYGGRIAQVEVRLPDRSPVALCEATHLEQVLTNLIGNALEYTRAAVEVGARQRDGWLEIFVADRGSGLPSDRRDYVFEKPGPAGQNRSRGGLGLGLYLCRLVVERSFGGRIWVERTGSAGTVFKFTVPAVPGRSRPSDEAELAEVPAG